jgi:cytochrome c oxidase cbb3-type subunit 4
MDFIDQLRAGVTLFSFLAFLALMAWAWSRRNRERFDEAAQLPFAPEAEDIRS